MSTRKRNKLGNDPLGWLDRPEPDTQEGQPEASPTPAPEPPPAKTPTRGRKTPARRTRTQESSEDTTMAANPQTEVANNAPDITMDSRFMQAACEGSKMAVMMCDAEMNIIYANSSVLSFLRDRRDAIRREFPDFDPDNLIGQSIDQFHKDPSHQRAILQNPAKLPYTAEIEVGGIDFKLQASGITDESGRIIGNMVEWQDVTEINEMERERARLRSAFKGATQAQLLTDEQLKIVYANPAAMDLLREHRAALQEMARDFDPLKPQGCDLSEIYQDAPRPRGGDHLSLPEKYSLKTGELQIDLNATELKDDEGEFSGYMVEWNDVTDLRMAEKDIDDLIRDAARGKLNERLTPDSYDGFVKNIAEGVNELLDAVVPPLREGSRVMQAMAEGDLTARLEGDFKGEFAEFRDAIHTSLENLDQLVGQILEGAGNVRSASTEIAQGNTDLSQRTEEQASSLEETASSMEEMTSTVKSNADNARQANQLATAARDKAQEGGEVVDKAVTAMGEINQSSKKIADIIGVIDEIAFQTNLLALNAAVEAARAGEQGRGFAVVATEVRNLAQRSAQAAKEIKTLINDSVERIGEGSKLVDNSGKALEDIVDSVKKVSDIIAEIAAASEEQSTGLDEINKAVTQLDEVTQQNAALVEEAAAASESLDDQSRELLELMSYFKGERAAAATTEMQKPKPAAPARTGSTELKRPASAGGNGTQRPAPAPSRQAATSEDWEEF
ncbi:MULTISPECIES: methyl-accepting chemotaxis protein [unclassified Thioalkalivibrio]|uniref:methyl-accepting chemotaxis protein n=1 Tax=unclassified Thioalkalivibrio TaxID=2621013 RepID=UPI00037C724A|nr:MULTISPECIES: methyl-accepting chemotaxis protein [unclassified Thioalkalivibrio]